MSNFSGLLNSLVIPVVGIIGVILIIKQPYWGLVFLAGMIPIDQILPDVPGLTSIAVALGAVTVASYIINRVINDRKIQFNPLSLAIYILAGLFTILIVVGQWLNPATLQIRNYGSTYLQLTLLVILCDQLMRNEKRIQTMMLVYIGAAQITVLSAVSQFTSYGGSAAQLFRPTGAVGNANELGIYASIAIVMCVYFIQTTRNGLIKLFTIFCLFTSAVALVLSGSRGAILFFIPVVIYQLLRGGRRSVQLVIVALVIFVMVAGFIPGSYWQRIADIPSVILNQEDTVGQRYQFWDLALNAWQTSPILGIGSGAVNIVLGESDLVKSGVSIPAHNTYITVLAENGLVGFMVYISILALTIYILFRLDWIYHRKNKYFTQLIIVWQATLAIILLNAVKGEWETSKISWICVGIALAFYGGTQLPKLHIKQDPILDK
jgi:O-antigen ligase